MNGEVPMMAPVTGSRSGAPGGSLSSRISAITPSRPRPAQRSPRESAAGEMLATVSGSSGRSCPDGAAAGS
jgi:hypothetical protein